MLGTRISSRLRVARDVHVGVAPSLRGVLPPMTILNDLQFTLRRLRRAPGFLVTALLSLTLAIAANLAVYGLAKGLLFRPLAIAKPQDVVQVQNPGFLGISFSYPNYVDLRDRTTRTFSSVTLARLTRFAIGVGGAAQPVWGFMAGGNYFQMLGIHAQLGRLLEPGDDVSVNGGPVMVLSDRCWRLRFGADPKVVGKVVPVGKIPFTVVGVAPPGFYGTERLFAPEVWLPFHDGPEVDGSAGFESRGSTNSFVFARLRPGTSRQQADADLRRVSAQVAREYPREDQGTAWHTATVGLLGETLDRPVRAFLGGLGALALLVLLAACANLGVLFSSRTADRARELGIRLAIGSSRQRILRQLALESVLIALVGGAVASVLANGLLHALAMWRPSADLPFHLLLEPDGTVYLAAGVLALLTGLLFGVLPARQIWRTDPNSSLRASGAMALPDRSRLRGGLLLVQIALCCLLVTAAFVALRGSQRAAHLPLGFEPEGVTLATVDVKLAGYEGASQPRLQQRLLQAVEAIPGVTAAAYSDNQPLSLNTNEDDVYPAGTASLDHAHKITTAMVYRVSPTYSAATGTHRTAGRSFTTSDDAEAPSVAIVNQTLARQLFGTVDAVGKRYRTGDGKDAEVVGVVADGKYVSLAEAPTPALFRPMLQAPDSTAVLIARSARPPAEMTVAMRKAVASVDPAIPIFSVSSWPDALGIVTLPGRAATVAMGVMGGLAAMLAVTGLFGVASYTVARRMREFGLRVALGARAPGILRAALGQTMLLMALGSAIGLSLAFVSTRLLAGIVYQASASDPLVLGTVALTMVALGAAASAVPARRATRANPAELLREP